MNDEDKIKILDVSKKYKHICISLPDFTTLAIVEPVDWIEATDGSHVMRDVYAYIGECKVHVGPIVASGFIRVSNHDNAFSRNDKNWSPEIQISNSNNIDRLMELRAFW